MKKAGIAFSLLIVAALAYVLLQPSHLKLARLRLYASGLAWSESKCSTSADCVAVLYRGKSCGWVTARANHGLSNLEATGKIISDLEPVASCDSGAPLVAVCANLVCAAGRSP